MAVLEARDVGFHGRGTNLVIISITFLSVAFCLVGARVTSRVTTGRKLGPDDYAIIASVTFSIGLTICNCISVEHGFGKLSTTLPRDDLRKALQSFWASQILYKLTINLTKTSICLLYLRIFTTVDKANFRRVVYCVMAYVLLYAFASIIATIFQCLPIERVWDKKIPGSCINLTAFWYANACANIIGDIGIFILPMPVIRSLNLPRREKWGLTMVFALGFFVCITSVLRMTTLDVSSKSNDQTYGTLNSTIWTTIEANTGIICACLPMLKKPLSCLFPQAFPRQSGNSSYPSSGFRTLSRQRNSPVGTYNNGWSHLDSKTKPPVSKSSGDTAVGKTSGGSGDGEYGIERHDIPLASITKTSTVDVRYVNDQHAPTLSPNSKKHTRSISNLVGEDFNLE